MSVIIIVSSILMRSIQTTVLSLKNYNIAKIIEKYHLEKAVYIGDTKKDLEAATQAGIPFIQAKYGFGEDLKTKYSISSFNALPIVLEQVFNKTKDKN